MQNIITNFSQIGKPCPPCLLHNFSVLFLCSTASISMISLLFLQVKKIVMSQNENHAILVKNQLRPTDHPLTEKLPFPGVFVNSLCVGRTHESADPLQFFNAVSGLLSAVFCKARTFPPFGSDRRSHDSALRRRGVLSAHRVMYYTCQVRPLG